MSNQTVRTVSVTCACGASFDREVKRGRPQVWCPACLEVPFYERERVQPVVVTDEDGVEIVAKPVNENDPLGHVRDQVEEAVAEANAEYKAQVEAAVEAGINRREAADLYRDEFNAAIKAVYVKYRGY